jgi:hypothetical protein
MKIQTFETVGLGLSDYDYRTGNFFCYGTIDNWKKERKKERIFIFLP